MGVKGLTTHVVANVPSALAHVALRDAVAASGLAVPEGVADLPDSASHSTLSTAAGWLLVDGPSLSVWIASQCYLDLVPSPAIAAAITTQVVVACRRAGLEPLPYYDGYGGMEAEARKAATISARREDALDAVCQIEEFCLSGRWAAKRGKNNKTLTSLTRGVKGNSSPGVDVEAVDGGDSDDVDASHALPLPLPVNMPASPALTAAIRAALSSLHVATHTVMGEADDYILRLVGTITRDSNASSSSSSSSGDSSHRPVFAILSDDSDFLCATRYDVPVISLRSLELCGDVLSSQPVELLVTLVRPSEVAESLSVPQRRLADIACLCGNDYTKYLMREINAGSELGIRMLQRASDKASATGINAEQVMAAISCDPLQVLEIEEDSPEAVAAWCNSHLCCCDAMGEGLSAVLSDVLDDDDVGPVGRCPQCGLAEDLTTHPKLAGHLFALRPALEEAIVYSMQLYASEAATAEESVVQALHELTRARTAVQSQAPPSGLSARLAGDRPLAELYAVALLSPAMLGPLSLIETHRVGVGLTVEPLPVHKNDYCAANLGKPLRCAQYSFAATAYHDLTTFQRLATPTQIIWPNGAKFAEYAHPCRQLLGWGLLRFSNPIASDGVSLPCCHLPLRDTSPLVALSTLSPLSRNLAFARTASIALWGFCQSWLDSEEAGTFAMQPSPWLIPDYMTRGLGLKYERGDVVECLEGVNALALSESASCDSLTPPLQLTVHTMRHVLAWASQAESPARRGKLTPSLGPSLADISILMATVAIVSSLSASELMERIYAVKGEALPPLTMKDIGVANQFFALFSSLQRLREQFNNSWRSHAQAPIATSGRSMSTADAAALREFVHAHRHTLPATGVDAAITAAAASSAVGSGEAVALPTLAPSSEDGPIDAPLQRAPIPFEGRIYRELCTAPAPTASSTAASGTAEGEGSQYLLLLPRGAREVLLQAPPAAQAIFHSLWDAVALPFDFEAVFTHFEQRDMPLPAEVVGMVTPQADAATSREPAPLEAHFTTLPISSHRLSIAESVARSTVSIVKGDTGSGKSSRVPQFILDLSRAKHRSHARPSGTVKGEMSMDGVELPYGLLAAWPETIPRIYVTQPRRVAAVTLAKRVADERGAVIGGEVGYRIGHDRKVGRDTNITFVTTGWMLQWLVHKSNAAVSGEAGESGGGGGTGDEGVGDATHIIMDEVHERGIDTDLVCLVIKVAINRAMAARVKCIKAVKAAKRCGQDAVLAANSSFRNRVRLILMSATFDTSVFADYFDDLAQSYATFLDHELRHGGLDRVVELIETKPAVEKALLPSWEDYDAEDGGASAAPGVSAGSTFRHLLGYVSSDRPHTLYVGAKRFPVREVFLEDTTSEHIGASMPRSELVYVSNMVQKFDNAVDVWGARMQAEERRTGKASTLAAGDSLFLDDREKQALFRLAVRITLAVARPGTGDCILIFVSGMSDIDQLCELFLEIAPHMVAPPTAKMAAAGEAGADADEMDLAAVEASKAAALLEAHKRLDDESRELPSIEEEEEEGGGGKEGGVSSVLPETPRVISGATAPQFGSMKLLPMHSMISFEDQMSAFSTATTDKRTRIVIATNIAESSVTLPDVHTVIDTGRAKMVEYVPKLATSVLRSTWISQASALQRSGRAGRLMPGTVYRLYTHAFFEHVMPRYDAPEMLRLSLDTVVLKVKMLGILTEDPVKGPVNSAKAVLGMSLQAPDEAMVDRALTKLAAIGALADSDDAANVTTFGKMLSSYPGDLVLGKLVAYGMLFGCLADAIILAAAMSVPDIFMQPHVAMSDSPAEYGALLSRSYRSRFLFGLDTGAGRTPVTITPGPNPEEDDYLSQMLHYSDAITSRNAYISWRAVPPRGAQQWCTANSVVPRKIGALHSMVREIGARIATDFPEANPIVAQLQRGTASHSGEFEEGGTGEGGSGKAGEGTSWPPVGLFAPHTHILRLLLGAALASNAVMGKAVKQAAVNEKVDAAGCRMTTSTLFGIKACPEWQRSIMAKLAVTHTATPFEYYIGDLARALYASGVQHDELTSLRAPGKGKSLFVVAQFSGGFSDALARLAPRFGGPGFSRSANVRALLGHNFNEESPLPVHSRARRPLGCCLPLPVLSLVTQAGNASKLMCVPRPPTRDEDAQLAALGLRSGLSVVGQVYAGEGSRTQAGAGGGGLVPLAGPSPPVTLGWKLLDATSGDACFSAPVGEGEEESGGRSYKAVISHHSLLRGLMPMAALFNRGAKKESYTVVAVASGFQLIESQLSPGHKTFMAALGSVTLLWDDPTIVTLLFLVFCRGVEVALEWRKDSVNKLDVVSGVLFGPGKEVGGSVDTTPLELLDTYITPAMLSEVNQLRVDLSLALDSVVRVAPPNAKQQSNKLSATERQAIMLRLLRLLQLDGASDLAAKPVFKFSETAKLSVVCDVHPGMESSSLLLRPFSSKASLDYSWDAPLLAAAMMTPPRFPDGFIYSLALTAPLRKSAPARAPTMLLGSAVTGKRAPTLTRVAGPAPAARATTTTTAAAGGAGGAGVGGGSRSTWATTTVAAPAPAPAPKPAPAPAKPINVLALAEAASPSKLGLDVAGGPDLSVPQYVLHTLGQAASTVEIGSSFTIPTSLLKVIDTVVEEAEVDLKTCSTLQHHLKGRAAAHREELEEAKRKRAHTVTVMEDSLNRVSEIGEMAARLAVSGGETDYAAHAQVASGKAFAVICRQLAAFHALDAECNFLEAQLRMSDERLRIAAREHVWLQMQLSAGRSVVKTLADIASALSVGHAYASAAEKVANKGQKKSGGKKGKPEKAGSIVATGVAGVSATGAGVGVGAPMTIVKMSPGMHPLLAVIPPTTPDKYRKSAEDSLVHASDACAKLTDALRRWAGQRAGLAATLNQLDVSIGKASDALDAANAFSERLSAVLDIETATDSQLEVFGSQRLQVDGKRVDVGATVEEARALVASPP